MTNDVFETHRPTLMAIAYRMLGSASEAEDAVQDTWLRWQASDRSDVRDPRAWLSTALTRLCIDRLTSARARREVYPGTWLPEPVLTPTPMDVESISMGLLVVLERLNPIERAVFVLSRVFDFTHAEIAETLSITEEASRQSLHRARGHVAADKPRFKSSATAHERVLKAFLVALSSGEVAPIAALLTEDAVLYGDGGGKVRGAILRPVKGRNRVARFFAGLMGKTPDLHELRTRLEVVNGWPALVGSDPKGVRFVLTIETDGTHIAVIRNVVNPDKMVLRQVN